MKNNVNPHQMNFLVKKKSNPDFENSDKMLLNLVLKSKVSFEVFCKIENHDDYNDALKTNLRRQKLGALIIAFAMACLTFPYVGIYSVIIFSVAAVFLSFLVIPALNKNKRFAVPSNTLWEYVYDCQYDDKFKAIFSERLNEKDMLFKDDYEYLQKAIALCYEENKEQWIDARSDEKIM